MKSKVFLYLFIFALLFILYQYMNEKKIFENQENQIELLSTKAESLEDSLELVRAVNTDLGYFSFIGNENAMSYFETFGFEAEDVKQTVTDQIYGQNTLGENNPLIPYPGMEGVMKINKIKFLNHRWIQADFTDGKYWGEMIIQYDLNRDKELTLTTISSFLYPVN